MTVNKRFFARKFVPNAIIAENQAVREDEKIAVGVGLLNFLSILFVAVYVGIMAFSPDDASSGREKEVTHAEKAEVSASSGEAR